jgi:probable F420-dependent oxidoreductase
LPGGDVPDHYRRTYDPFVALALAAGVTRRIRLGTGICLVTEHDPLVLAKTVASLDRLSGGRVVLGVGAGWNALEMENHGTAYATRWLVLRERILAMKCLWRDDVAEFHGNHVSFGPAWSWPKPLQPGGPPIWIGSNSAFAPARVAEYADGWMPIVGRAGGADIAALRTACAAAGRPPQAVTAALFYAPLEPAEAERRCQEGYTDFIFGLPPSDRDGVLPVLDRIAQLARGLRETTHQPTDQTP